MTRSVCKRAVVTVVVLALVALSSPAGAQSFKWWKSEQFRKDVGLTPEQCGRIDKVFRATFPKLRQGKEELDRQEAELSTMVEFNADEALVIRQVDRVETTRASLNKMRTLMLLHMHQVLNPDQLVRFKAAHDQWKRDHQPPLSDGSPSARIQSSKP